jgi:hypothetical protein
MRYVVDLMMCPRRVCLAVWFLLVVGVSIGNKLLLFVGFGFFFLLICYSQRTTHPVVVRKHQSISCGLSRCGN